MLVVEGGVGSAAHSNKNNVFAYRKEKKKIRKAEREEQRTNAMTLQQQQQHSSLEAGQG